MTRKSIAVLVFLSVLVITGCKISPVFKVAFTDVGIVTQNGKIVGEPRKPGLHFKIPFLQQVHAIHVQLVQFFSLPVKGNEALTARVLWRTTDPITYFRAFEAIGDEKKLRAKLSSDFSAAIDTFSPEALSELADARIKDRDFSNDTYERLVRSLQESSMDAGVDIYRVDFERE